MTYMFYDTIDDISFSKTNLRRELLKYKLFLYYILILIDIILQFSFFRYVLNTDISSLFLLFHRVTLLVFTEVLRSP